jgi:hypothetical protein
VRKEQVAEWANKAGGFHLETFEQFFFELCRLAREDMREQCAKFVETKAWPSGEYLAKQVRNLEV